MVARLAQIVMRKVTETTIRLPHNIAPTYCSADRPKPASRM